nr:immunoglobulin light chain junction region [Macaca mulatta]
CHQYNYWITF